MHQIVSSPVDSPHRGWVLAIVASAQFMFGVDAFSGVRAKHRRARLLITGLAALVAAIEWIDSPTVIVLALLIACAAFLTWMRRATAA